MKYELTLTLEQARIVQDGLNFYFRSFLGQLDLWHLDLDYDQRDILEQMMKHFMNLSKNASHGIHSEAIPDVARKACDIHGVIRHQLWLDLDDEYKSKYTVDSYPPEKYGKLPLPEIRNVE